MIYLLRISIIPIIQIFGFQSWLI